VELNRRRLVMLVYGRAGSGKSWLINTAPGPRLLLDAEGRSDYLADLRADPTGMTPQRLVFWNPRDEIPAESSDPNVVTVVDVATFDDLNRAYQWLAYKEHPFKSVGIDSLQEVQERLIEEISGTQKMEYDHWGEALKRVMAMLRKFVDLRKHAKHNYIDALVVVIGSKDDKDDGRKQLLMLQGQASARAPFKFDVIGYLAKGRNKEGDKVRYMTIDSYDPNITAKDNTHVLTHKYGEHIFNPDVEQMLAVLNPTDTEDASE
jgi:hypothetical protein